MRRPKSKKKFVLFSAHLTPEQKESLEALSARTKVPQTAYLRAAVALILAKPELVQEEM
jgi:predicted DNA-binding protein